jgi:hypothetical protein
VARALPRPVHTAEHTTQDELDATLAALVGRARALTRHLEVETYTGDVLPGAPTATTPSSRARRELQWTRDRLVALGAEEIA